MEDTKKIDYNKNDNKKKRNKINFKKYMVRFFAFLKNNTKTMNSTIGIITAAIVVVVVFLNIVIPDKTFSEKENRMLATFPDFSWNSVVAGSFASNAETYVTDQFVGRDTWIKLRSRSEIILGKYNSNGVYMGADGYLFEDITEPDEEHVTENVGAVNAFTDAMAQRGISSSMLIAPNSANIMSDYLPVYAPVRDQNIDMDTLFSEMTQNLNIVDVRDALKKASADMQVYYRTDHHWNTYGAYIAFCSAAEHMGIDLSETNFTKYTLTDKFTGTLASKSGFPVSEPDVVEAYIPDSDIEYMVKYTEEEEKSASVYKPENLKKNDKYTVFFGGNFSRVDISTTRQSKDRILIIKDSYANCFVPFMIPYYNKIIMVDPRYYNDNIYSLVEEEGITQILFLYNANTFFEDSSLSGVLDVQAVEG